MTAPSGCGVVGKFGNCADVEAGAAQLEGCQALIVPDDVGDIHFLRTQAFGYAYVPLAAYDRAGSRGLGEDVSRRDIARVVAIVHIEVEAHAGSLTARVGHGHAFEGRNLDLSSVDREVHGGYRREERHHDQRHNERGHTKRAQQDVAAHGSGSPSG